MADAQALRDQLEAAVDVVTRLSKKCDKSKGLPLDKISVVMVGKKLKAFETAVQEAQEVCQALEALKEDVDEISDSLETMEQETTDQLNHLLHRGTASTYIRTIQLMLTTVEQEIERDGYRSILSNEVKSISDALGSMNIMRSQPGAGTCKELQELAMGVTKRYREVQIAQSKAAEIPEVKEVPPSACSHNNNQGLPLVIPTFDGQTLSWKRWWNTFSSIMKENRHLTEYSQRCHLLTAMGTPEAKEFALKTFELEPTHAQAIAEIRAKYEDHRTLHRHYHQQYFINGTVESSRKSLEVFSDKFRATYKAFTECKVDTAGQVMIMHALLQFSPTLLTQWKKSNKKRKFTPTYEVMSEFLKDQLECLGEEEATTLAAAGYKKNRTKIAPAATALQTRPEGQTLACCLCQGSHFLAFCPRYEAKSLADRIQFVKDSNLCFNCLGSSHMASDCRNQKRCKKCKRRHHTSIHEQRMDPDDYDEEVDAQTNRVEIHPGNIPPRLIKTALVCTRAQGLEQKARAQFDSGATVSLITARLARTLRAPVVPRSAARLAGINGAHQPLMSKHRVRVTLRGTQGEEIDICPQVIESIAPTPCRLDLKKVRSLPFLQDLTLADPTYSSLARIDLLIDVEASNACHTETVISGPTPGLKAHQTIFGWTLSGGDTLGFGDEDVGVALRAQPLDDPIQVFRDLLALEEEADENFSRDELEALRDFSERVNRDEHGRYSVGCPHRKPTVPLGKSRESALRRFLSLERVLTAKGEWAEFSAAILDYFESGHSEEVPPEDLRKPISETYYLPMHGVRKETSTSTKLRVVFDASAKSSTGNSLNDTLLPGPALHPLLTSVITLFRSFEIGFSADISRMFRGIGLNKAERDYHRYFQRGWDGLLREMRHTRVVFGVTCSPFLANQVVRQVGIDHGEEYPLAAALIKSNYYVDDCLAGANTVDEAYEAVTQSIEMMKRACFDLKKWRSNSRELLDRLPSELCEASDLKIPTTPSDCSRALGIHWDPRADVLYVATPTIDLELVATRREVARAIAKIYDLLGFFSPYILQARMVLQATWDLVSHWDAELPEALQTIWREWLLGLTSIAHHPIPRYMGEKGKQVYSIQLHGFADASFSALGGVVYVRYFHQDLNVHVGLVASRMRVVPRKKRPTIPRLELCAALVLSQLMSRVQEDLKVPPDATYYWSDSSVVLGWLRHPPGELKTFVANRVEKIQQLTTVPHWRHVKSNDNPADILSRGVSAQELVQSQLWWEGPPWLSLKPDVWPCAAESEHEEELPDIKGIVQTVSNAAEEFGRECSTFEELVRSIALMRRFLRRDASKPLYITVIEYLHARQWVLRRSQEFWYPHEYQLLKANKFLPPENSLASLNPFLDDQGVMRVGGRLQKAGLHPAVAHPVILNVKSHVVQLFITHNHHLLHHAGPSTVMSTMAVHYYVPSIGRFLRTLSKRCVPCRTFRAQTGKQQMGELPETRVTVARPFSVIGMDFAGPFQIKRGRIRDPTKLKAYVCVFLCYVTRAVHLELVSEMTTQAFLAALTRFVGVRGAPTRIETDNGSNFIGAEVEIREAREALLQADDWNTVERWSATRGIIWKFIPVRSPQTGGYWEAAVGSMKSTLCRLMKPHLLDFEEFSTVLAEAAAILNSRPLVAMDAPADDAIEPLTPGHFLVGAPLTAVPFRHEKDTPLHLLRRWNLVKRLQHDLWERWREEYLTKLQRRSKDKRPAPSFREGDVVIETNLGTFQREWPMAVVVRIRPGTDGLVRTVDIRRPNGKVVCRGIRYLVHLFSESAGSDSDGGECSGQEDD